MKYDILLYVGCGSHRIKGFTHVEISTGKQFKKGGDVGPPDILADITEHIPLPDNSVTMIFSRATLEHLTYDELLNHFIECHRLLKKGGVVRMQVPNFESYINDYQNRSPYDLNKMEIGVAFPLEDYVDVFVSRMLYHDHYYLHNFITLEKALLKCGFSSPRECIPGDSVIKFANQELTKAEQNRSGEIIVEAMKLDEVPAIKFKERALHKRFIPRMLAKYFNIRLISFVRRRPMFPSKYWFLERRLVKKIKTVNFHTAK